jgi:hypothetical protein
MGSKRTSKASSQRITTSTMSKPISTPRWQSSHDSDGSETIVAEMLIGLDARKTGF